jgi:peptide/nickel transport system permease protein
MGLRVFIVKRLLLMILTLFVLMTLTFILFRIAPGDPVGSMVSVSLNPGARESLMRSFGLDKPLYIQYLLYVKNLLRGDMGQSFYYRLPVAEVLRPKLVNTVLLVGPATILALVLGVLIGALTAARRAGRLDLSATVFSLAIKAMPPFWTGMIALVVFSYTLNWFPSAGLRSPGHAADSMPEKFLNPDFLHHLALPMTILTVHFLAQPLLTMRNSMLDVHGEDFIDMARAKGIGERHVVYRHWIRNALLPVASIIPVMIGAVVGGQVLVETVFSWPGLGREMVTAVNGSDYPVAQASFLMIGAVTIGMNFVADIAYAILDPRVRLE